MRLLIVSLLFERADRVRSLATVSARRGLDVAVLTSEEPDGPQPFPVHVVPYERAGARARAGAQAAGATNVADAAAARGTLAAAGVRWAARAYETLLAHPDRHGAWVRAVRRWADGPGASALAGADVVFAVTPASGLLAGREVARRAGAALVLDFQDPWAASPYYPYPAWRRAVDRRRERSLVASADAVVALTRPLARLLAASHPGTDIRAVGIGIDPAPWRAVAADTPSAEVADSEGAPAGTSPAGKTPLSHVLRFSHVGVTYGGRRDLRPLMGSLARLGASGRVDLTRVRIDLVGEADAPALEAAGALGLGDVVTAVGPVPPADVPALLARTGVAVLASWDEDRFSMPLKSRHYLAARKRILVLGATPDSEIARALGGLPGVDLPGSPAEIDDIVARAWDDFAAGHPLDVGDAERPFTWTDEAMADDLVGILEAAASHRHPRPPVG